VTDAGWASFDAPYRVRFDEAGSDGLLRTSGLLRYAQDIAWQHSVARGFGRTWYGERGLAWVVRAVDLTVIDEIPLGVELEATTRVIGQRRVWARRVGEFRLQGRPVSRVQTDWLLLDASNRPTRLPAEFEGAFPILSAADGLARVEIPAPPTDASRRTFLARPQELDPMGHLNNAVYVDWLEESILASGLPAPQLTALPRRVRLEYAGSVDPAAPVVARTWVSGDRWLHRLDREGGPTLATAVLSTADAAR
jgi:acyl-ACP thioesterase